jgi:hypothetical protein
VNLEQAFATYDEIYRLVLDDQEFYFRPLTRKELRVLQQSCYDGFDLEESVGYLCLIQPEEYDFENCKAGIPAILCLAILRISGFTDPVSALQLLEEARKQTESDMDRQMDCVIIQAFPAYKLEDLEQWTRKKLIETYAMAEWALREFRGVQLDFQGNQQQVPGLKPPPGVPRGGQRNR